jgi:peptide deformylase
MTILTIVQAPNPIFAIPCTTVTQFNHTLKQLSHDMLTTLYHHQALGLGANMIGSTQAIMVVDLQPNKIKQPYVFINPKIHTYSDKTCLMPEASLSFSNVRVKIKRPESLAITYQDANGTQQNLSASGLLARVIQHEYDYLQGTTFINHLSKVRQKIALAKLNQ